MIRAASYNIRKSIGLDRRRDPRRILSVLNEINADIVALQEADRRVGARATSIPPELIAAETDLKVVPVAIRPDSIGWHGNALLVHRDTEILDSRRHDLPTLEPRGAVSADLKINGVALRAVGLHLSLLHRYRKRQFEALAEQLDTMRDKLPTILMGDTNEWRKQGSLTALPPRFVPAAPGPSFHSAQPVASLDRIILCDRIEIHTGAVHRSEQARVASDHLPIWADLAVRDFTAVA